MKDIWNGRRVIGVQPGSDEATAGLRERLGHKGVLRDQGDGGSYDRHQRGQCGRWSCGVCRQQRFVASVISKAAAGGVD